MMNKRFLMRLGKNPFEPVSGYGTLDRNTIGGNNGNLIFGAAAHKLFSTEGVTVEANNYQVDKSMADRINSEYDAFILPLANEIGRASCRERERVRVGAGGLLRRKDRSRAD